MLGNDSVHALVGTQNGIGWAGLDAERAANAPGFVNDGQRARRIYAVLGAQWDFSLAGDDRKTANAFLAARWALIDGGFPAGNGPCIYKKRV